MVKLFICHINLPPDASCLLTHGLVSGGYRRGMVENQDLGLELPRCLWAQLWGNHHHALPNGRAFDLHTEKEDCVKPVERRMEVTAAA